MIGNGLGQTLSDRAVDRRKSQECDHRFPKIFNVTGLDFLAAASVGLLFLREGWCGALDLELLSKLFDGLRRGPDSSRKYLSALLLGNNPMLAGRLHSSCQSGITRRQQNPARRDRQNLAIKGTDAIWSRSWTEGVGAQR